MRMCGRSPQSVTFVGFGCLLVTAVGWGLNWPATKALIHECPPLTARGVAGVVAAAGLACLAKLRGESMVIPRAEWLRLVRCALLNVTAWMGLTTLSMLWLPAGEAATIAYTMPVWAALIAWPLLGERLALGRGVSLGLGVVGVCILLGKNSFHDDAITELPGIMVALIAATLFALGTVSSKRWPLSVPPIAATAWQVGLGCLPLLAASYLFENANLREMPPAGWLGLFYTAAVSLGVCYVSWFAALRRLDAGTAAIGTLLTPVVGVLASSVALGDALLLPQLSALVLVSTGVFLAVR
jgi:drug/metabolite transporter (DMT)-like permease